MTALIGEMIKQAVKVDSTIIIINREVVISYLNFSFTFLAVFLYLIK